MAPPGSRRKAVAAVAAVLAVVGFVHVLWWLLGDSAAVNGNLADSDGYARLVRIERLVETGGWFDVSLPRADWPYGGSLHWTRPLDVLLILLALPAAAIVGFGPGLFWAGVVVSPLLHGGAAVTVMWASRPLIGRVASVVAGMLSAVAFGVLGYATIGHADQHILVGLISVSAFGYTVRALLAQDKAGNHALRAGVVLALGVWVGVEVQVTAGLCLGVVALKWVVEGGKWLAVNRQMALGLVLGLASALAVERGAGVFDVQYDRLSIVHVTLSVMILGFWSGVGLLGERLKGAGSRLAAGACGDVVIVTMMVALYPKVLLSPLYDVDPVLLEIFASVAEYAPVSDPWRFLVYAGGVIFALPWTLVRTVQEPERWGWLLLCAGLAIYTVFTLNWIRWSLYVGLFSSMALAHLIVRADGVLDGLGPAVRGLSKVTVLLAIAIGPFTVGMAGVAGSSEAPAKTTAIPEPVDGDARPCPVRAVSRFLNGTPWGDKPLMILSSANDGAELLY